MLIKTALARFSLRKAAGTGRVRRGAVLGAMFGAGRGGNGFASTGGGFVVFLSPRWIFPEWLAPAPLNELGTRLSPSSRGSRRDFGLFPTTTLLAKFRRRIRRAKRFPLGVPSLAGSFPSGRALTLAEGVVLFPWILLLG